MTHAWTTGFALLAKAKIDYVEVAVGAAMLLALMTAAFLGVMLLRRRLKDGSGASAPQAFTLEDLRRLHGQGQLSDEEYERARDEIIALYGVHRSTTTDGETGEKMGPEQGSSSS